MTEERVQRRLAAILAADVVGYSRLMGEDEMGTLNALNLHRAELIHPTVAEHRGRIVKLMGDGALVEFPSVVDAVECAVAVQRGMAERNSDIPDSKRITFRIGINLGDIIIEGDDIYGDGVNVAARLEGEADPGGICISGDAYRQVNGKIDLAFEDLGERALKNIVEPVRAYRWLSKTGATQAETTTAPPPPSDKPTIAVLSFDNLSNDPEQEYFSDGLVEDLITDISKVSGLFIIARNSSFAFKGQAIGAKEIAEKLGVKYVVEGSVRKMGSRLRINAQLIDAATDGHLWAERYDGDLENIFEFQDDIRDQIVAALQVSLTPAEKSETQRHLTDSVEAYELFLRARTEFVKFTPESIAESIRLYQQATDVDPNFAAAYANLSTVLQTSWSMVLPGCEGALERAFESAQRAVEIDPQLSLAHTRLGWVQCFMRQHDAAIASFDRALELSPNDAEAYAYLSHVYNYLGEPERAIELVKTAFRFDPMLPPNVAFHWGEACFQARRYDEALEKLHECLDKAPGFYNARLFLAAALSEMGREEEAVSELQIVRDQIPDEIIRTNVQQQPYRSEEAHARMINGVREAGLPDEILASKADAPLPLPDKPSIAVLPFNNMSNDPEQEYFADGMTEDLITDLSQISGLFVIARNSSFAFKGQSVDIKDVGEKLGVRFVLEGSVRKAGDKIRINAQLIDAGTGGHIWAQRYDGNYEDIFALQDEITAKIVSALEVNLTRQDSDRARHRATVNIDAYDLFLRGRTKFYAMTPAAFIEAGDLFQQAVELDPEFADPYIYLSFLQMVSYIFIIPGFEDGLNTGQTLAEKAVALDDQSGMARTQLGWIQLWLGEHDLGLANLERGVELDPTNAETYAYLAESLNYAGDPERAVDMTRKAQEYDPVLPPNCQFHLGHSYYLLGKFNEAAEVISGALKMAPEFLPGHIILAAAYAELGQIDLAGREIEIVGDLAPNCTVVEVGRLFPHRPPEVKARLLEALGKAGMRQS